MNNYLFLETNENVAIDPRWETLYALSYTIWLNRNSRQSARIRLRETRVFEVSSPSEVWYDKPLALESIYHVFVVDWTIYA